MKNTLETRLGIFFALALVVAVLILKMIGAFDFFKGGYLINASFRNAQELKKGDQVKLAGVEIGRVQDISLEQGRARVVMKIQSEYEVKTDSEAAIKFTGLMGQNYVAIQGGTDAALPAQPGFTIQTLEQPDLSTLMAKLENVATGVEGLTKSFSTDNLSSLLGPLLNFVKDNSPVLTAMFANMRMVSDNLVQGKGTVGKLITDDALYDSTLGAVTNFQAAATDLKTMMGEAESMIQDARQVVARINAGQGTLGRLAQDEALYTEAAAMMKNLREISDKINRGQGSVGKLVNDETFLKNAQLSLQKLDKATDSLEDQGPLSVLGIAISTLF